VSPPVRCRLHVDRILFATQFLLSCLIITPLLCLSQIIMTLYMTLSTFRWILRPRTIKMERCFTLCIPFLRAPCSKPMVDTMDLIRPDHVQSHLGKFCAIMIARIQIRPQHMAPAPYPFLRPLMSWTIPNSMYGGLYGRNNIADHDLRETCAL
jgi:hypothetical protein